MQSSSDQNLFFYFVCEFPRHKFGAEGFVELWNLSRDRSLVHAQARAILNWQKIRLSNQHFLEAWESAWLTPLSFECQWTTGKSMLASKFSFFPSPSFGLIRLSASSVCALIGCVCICQCVNGTRKVKREEIFFSSLIVRKKCNRHVRRFWVISRRNFAAWRNRSRVALIASSVFRFTAKGDNWISDWRLQQLASTELEWIIWFPRKMQLYIRRLQEILGFCAVLSSIDRPPIDGKTPQIAANEPRKTASSDVTNNINSLQLTSADLAHGSPRFSLYSRYAITEKKNFPLARRLQIASNLLLWFVSSSNSIDKFTSRGIRCNWGREIVSHFCPACNERCLVVENAVYLCEANM